MAARNQRSRPCTPAIRSGRLRKALQFLDAAELIEDIVEDGELADAYVTLCVHAGIAAADVVCCARLGVHAIGEDHNAAAELLGRTDKDAERHLRTLLGMKTRSGYSELPVSDIDRKRAGRAASSLVARARIA